MVTAETAVVLPVLLLVLAAAVAAITVVGAQLRCVDAAREAARAAARGESAAVSGLAARAAPGGAVTRLTVTADEVHVSVSAEVAPLGPLPLRVHVSATAAALRELGADPPQPALAGPSGSGPSAASASAGPAPR